MACSLTEEIIYGYEDCRFEKAVDENFHCSICYNVLREPRTCRNNEHIFCLACITQHLKLNNQTCPECNEHLSVDTLRRPRLVNNYLAKLKINCDYASRGCPEFTCLGDLKTHVESCGFAPALCSNAECGMVVDKQEIVHHETVVCEYRKVKCHDCGQIQGDVGTIKGSLTKVDGKVEEVRREMMDSNAKVMTKVRAITETVNKVNKDVDELKVMMSQMLQKMSALEILNKLPFPTEGVLNTPKGDILIAGGDGLSGQTGKCIEVYSWERNCWFKASSMNQRHIKASSFIYNNQLFVVGGSYCEMIETLNLDELPLKWMEFHKELPCKCDGHQTVVCEEQIIQIGGDIYRKGRSNAISELQLTSLHLLNELGQMSKPRYCHAAEIFEDKVLIFGGVSEHSKILDSVLEFDPKKNECKQLPLLPYPLARMATTRWGDKVFVLGGRDKNGQVLKAAFMYDCKTGKTTALPSMLERRCDCCAVIIGDKIVVMGGENEKLETLCTVECFTLGGSAWEYLPAMNETRWGAVAEALPSEGLVQPATAFYPSLQTEKLLGINEF